MTTTRLALAFMLVSAVALAGTLQNSHQSTIGYITSNGAVEDSHQSTIGYARDVPTSSAAVAFFFFFFNKR